MAFENRNFSVIAYANNWTWLHYISSKDTLADIEKDDYFAPLRHLVNSGDMITITPADGGSAIRVFDLDEKTTKIQKTRV